MNVLITGISGFAGSHLAEYILHTHRDTMLHGSFFSSRHPEHIAHLLGKYRAHTCDIEDKPQTFALIRAIKPDIIFHLAAQSYVSSSWENPERTLTTNIIGQSNLLEAVRAIGLDTYNPVIVIPGSSEEYGQAVGQIKPLTEDAPLKPLSPYALSKVAQDYMGYQYWKSYDMKVIRLRVFNHTGPRRDPVFGVSNFCKKIAEIEKGIREPRLEIRDLTATRDFTDVRDIVRAYSLAAEKCAPGEVYNVCSGNGISFEQIVDTLLVLSSVKNISLVPDAKGTRPTDGGAIVGDRSKFTSVTCWQPEIDFLTQTIPDLLNYWREKV